MTKDSGEERLPFLHSGNTKEETSENNHLSNTFLSLRNGIIGILAALGYVISHVTSGTCIQLLEHRIPDLELSALRGFTGVVICSTILFFQKSSPFIPFTELKGTLFYSFTAAIARTVYYLSFALAPAAGVHCCMTSVNMASGLILFWLFWNERINLWSVFFTFLCICGVVLILQPWDDVTKTVQSSKAIFKCTSPNLTQGLCEKCGTIQHCFLMEMKDSPESAKLPCVCWTNNCTDFDNETSKNTSDQIHIIHDPNRKNGTCHFMPKALTAIDDKTKLLLQIKKLENSVCWPYSCNNNTKEINWNLNAFFQILLPENIVWFIGYGFAMLAGFGGSLFTLIWKYFHYLSENAVRSVNFQLFVQAVLSTILMAIIETPVFLRNFYDITLVVIHCLTSISHLFGFVFAVKYITAQTYFLILSTETVFYLLVQYTILSSILPGHRNWIEVLGVCFVLLGSFLSSVVELFGKKIVPEK